MGNTTRTYGDIDVTLTSAFDFAWNDYGSGAEGNGGFWNAKSQRGNKELRPLGSVVASHWDDINNEWAVLLVGDAKTNTSAPPVASPTDYKPLWNDAGTGSKHDGTFWRPVAPPEYFALGDVAWPGRDKPPLDLIWCLHKSIVNDGDFKEGATWNDSGSGARTDASMWEVVPRAKNPEGGKTLIPTLAGTFTVAPNYDRPNSSLARVPCLFVPKEERSLPTYPPRFTADKLPEKNDKFNGTITGTVSLPFTAFFDPNDRACLDRIVDPFCTINKKVSWTVLQRKANPNSTPEHYSTDDTFGRKKASETKMEHTIGITMSTEFGLFTKWSVSLNYQFSYSSSESREEFEEHKVSKSWEVPPYHMSLWWGRHISFEGVRSDNSVIGQGISYKGDENMVVNVPVPPEMFEGENPVKDDD